jgi:uncharacterized membrane protein YkvA (DUF1232 family)
MGNQALKTKAKELRANLGLLYFAFKHKRTPWYVKVLICLVISYALSPIDLIPDFIPVIGYLDDLIIIPAGIALAIKLIPEDIILECRENMSNLGSIKFNGIYAGIIIIAIWLTVIYLIFKGLIKLYNFVI